MKIIIISAIAKNNVIGRTSGEMPWHSKEEFKHFKSTTYGYPVIMGRKTFESLGEPLKGRLNIILTNNKNYKPDFDNIVVLNGLDKAINYCLDKNFEKIFITGGKKVFEEGMNFADEMILSFMDFDADGDVLFPEITNDWNLIKSDKRDEFEIKFFEKKK